MHIDKPGLKSWNNVPLDEEECDGILLKLFGACNGGIPQFFLFNYGGYTYVLSNVLKKKTNVSKSRGCFYYCVDHSFNQQLKRYLRDKDLANLWQVITHLWKTPLNVRVALPKTITFDYEIYEP